MESLSDIFTQEEARRIAETQAEIAHENAKRAAMTQEERDAIDAARFARLEAFDAPETVEPTVCEMCGETLTDGDCPSCDAD